MGKRRFHVCRRSAWCAVTGGLVATPVFAQVNWIAGPGTGNWSTKTNWAGNAVPSPQSTPQMSNSDSGVRTIIYDYTGPQTQFNGIRIDQTGTGTNTLSIAANLLSSTVGDEDIGLNGRGFVTQSGGTNSMGGFSLALGGSAGSSGFYNLSGGTLTGNSVFIGTSGTGSFTQTGGSVTLTGFFSLGGKSGEYKLSGNGTLSALSLATDTVSTPSTRTFTQSGGSVTISDSVYWGAAGGTSTLNLSGGQFSAATEFIGIGTSASALLSQTGGTNTATNLTIGYSGGAGTYNLFGPGLLNVTERITVGNGFFNQTAGSVSADEMLVGPTGASFYTQQGGSVTVANLSLANSKTGAGNYLLTGSASLTVTSLETIGLAGTGKFTHSGGTHTVSVLMIGDLNGAGTYVLSDAGVLNVTNFISVGYSGAPGTFTQTGGSHQTPDLIVGNGLDGAVKGIYALSGSGKLTADQEAIGSAGGQGFFNQSGGNNTVKSLFVGTDVSGTSFGIGNYGMSNSASLTVSGSESIGAYGGQGFFGQSGGTHTVGSSNGASLQLAVDRNSMGTFSLSGGTLNTKGTKLGAGSSLFAQSGGTHTVTGDLTLTPGQNQPATYQLSGDGLLKTTNTIVGGTIGPIGYPEFIQYSGNHTATASIKLLADSVDYKLSGGSVSTPSFEVESQLIQSGGTMFTNTLFGNGALLASGGTISAGNLRVRLAQLSGNARVTIKSFSGNPGTSKLKSLSIQDAATLDLADSGMLIDYDGQSPIASIRTAIVNGAASNWTGPGLISSFAATHPGRTVGYGEASSVLGLTGGQTANFLGQSADSTTVLVRYTLAGDTNLDGTVNFTDLVALAQHYGIADGSATWVQGDSNYDGNVDFADLVTVAQNYAGKLPASGVPAAGVEFQQDLARAFAAVPEPGSVLHLAAVGLLLRRRRKTSAQKLPPT